MPPVLTSYLTAYAYLRFILDAVAPILTQLAENPALADEYASAREVMQILRW